MGHPRALPTTISVLGLIPRCKRLLSPAGWAGVFVHVPRIMAVGRIAIWRAEEPAAKPCPYAVDRGGRGYDLKRIIDGAIAMNLSMANSLLSAGE